MKIQKTSLIQPESFNCLIYGQSGAGKTTLASTLESILVISCEAGVLSLKDFDIDYIEVTSLKGLNEALEYAQESDYKNIFIDSLTEISQMIHNYAKEKYPQDSHVMKLYGHTLDLTTMFIKRTRDMKKNIIYTALEKYDKSETGKRYYVPDLVGSSSTKVVQFFDFVFSLQVIEKEDGGKVRALLTDSKDNYIAKSRLKLSEYEPPHLGRVISKAYNKKE